MTETTERRLPDSHVQALPDVAAAVHSRLVGTWTTELDNDGKPAFGLSSFSSDGGVTAMQVNAKNIGLGNWKATGHNTFEYNFHILAADDDGEMIGEAHINVAAEFVSGTQWKGVGGATFYSPQGKPLRSHSGNKVVATKYGIDT